MKFFVLIFIITIVSCDGNQHCFVPVDYPLGMSPSVAWPEQNRCFD